MFLALKQYIYIYVISYYVKYILLIVNSLLNEVGREVTGHNTGPRGSCSRLKVAVDQEMESRGWGSATWTQAGTWTIPDGSPGRGCLLQLLLIFLHKTGYFNEGFRDTFLLSWIQKEANLNVPSNICFSNNVLPSSRSLLYQSICYHIIFTLLTLHYKCPCKAMNTLRTNCMSYQLPWIPWRKAYGPPRISIGWSVGNGRPH